MTKVCQSRSVCNYVHQHSFTFSISASPKYVPQTLGPSREGQGLAFGFPPFERAVHRGRAELGQRRQALPVEATLRDASLPVGGGPLADGRAGALQDELDVAGVLAPLVERHHGVLVGGQVALRLTPFLY